MVVRACRLAGPLWFRNRSTEVHRLTKMQRHPVPTCILIIIKSRIGTIVTFSGDLFLGVEYHILHRSWLCEILAETRRDQKRHPVWMRL
jgi:hypothetical protein